MKINKIFVLILVLFCTAIFAAACGEKSADNPEGRQLRSISTEDLRQNIGSDDWVVVDTRVNDAFNGWALDGVSRGGHIKGAVDFAAVWLDVDVEQKEDKLGQILAAKGISPERHIVLYDANAEDAAKVADYLKEKGFTDLYQYDVKEWADNPDLPMESYPNHKLLVPASWINELIANNNNGKPFKVFEVSWGEESEDYIKGHIPGAVHINTDEMEEPPIWNRVSDERLQQFAVNNGINVDTTVVLYGADSMAAYRVQAVLKYMGVKDVRVLNGGLPAWINGGYDVETKVNEKMPGDTFGAQVPVNAGYVIDLPGAKEILADKEGSKLVDIRSWDEFIGKTPGYSDITAKGRPAGVVWGHDIGDYRNIDATMRNAGEILAMWKEWDITPDQKLAFFCGTGWRAAEVLIYADVMGLQDIALYDGGWYEWSDDPANPVETGEPVR